MTEFVKDLDRFKDAFVLAITSVENWVMCEGKIEFLSRTTIIENVKDFLNSVREYLKKKSTKESDRALALVTSLIENGNIALFSRPIRGEKLSDNPKMQKERKNILEVLERGKFVDVYEGDFGYTISSESKEFVARVVDEIRAGLAAQLGECEEELFECCRKEMEEVKDVYAMVELLERYVEKFLDTVVGLEGCISLFKFLKNINEHFRKFLGSSHRLAGKFLMRMKYVEFLDSVCDRAFQVDMSSWKQCLSNVLRRIINLKHGYDFLIKLCDQLSTYEVYSDFKRCVATSDLTTVITKKDLETIFSKLRNVLLPTNFVLQFVGNDDCLVKHFGMVVKGMEPCRMIVDSGRLLVKGRYVCLSEVNRYLVDIPVEKVKEIVIFGLSIVFIDADFKKGNNDLKFVIIAPKWVVVGERKILMEGVVCSKRHKEETALKGLDGRPGFPGEPGGCFMGVAYSIMDASLLTISTRGGQGSPGQSGGDGLLGSTPNSIPLPTENEDFDDGFAKIVTSSKKINESSKYIASWANLILTSKTFDVKKFVIPSMEGTQGGDGGKAGRGGIGGRGGQCLLHVEVQENGTCSIQRGSGRDGDKGHPGGAGQGGTHSCKYELSYKENNFYFLGIIHVKNILPKWQVISETFTGAAEPGNVNFDVNINNIELPREGLRFYDPCKYIHEYKKYMLDIIDDVTIKNSRIFLIYLLDNVQTKYHSIENFIEDLDIVDNFAKKIGYANIIPFYESLLIKIPLFAKNFQKQKKTLLLIHTAVLTKLSLLKEVYKIHSVIDTITYLELVRKHTSVFHPPDSLLIDQINYLKNIHKNSAAGYEHDIIRILIKVCKRLILLTPTIDSCFESGYIISSKTISKSSLLKLDKSINDYNVISNCDITNNLTVIFAKIKPIIFDNQTTLDPNIKKTLFKIKVLARNSQLHELIFKIDVLIHIINQLPHHHQHHLFHSYVSKLPQTAHSSLTPKIHLNTVLQQFYQALHRCKLHIFPFGHDLLPLENGLDGISPLTLLVDNAKWRLRQINSIIKDDGDVVMDFRSSFSELETTTTFYTWTNINETIFHLLNGKKVIVQANVRNTNWDCLKFRQIGIELSFGDQDLKNVLNNYKVTLKHLGDSYYRCDGSYYNIMTGVSSFLYSFGEEGFDEQGQFLDRLPFLSPYATWSLQIDGTGDLHEFQSFADEMTVNLIGKGQFVRLGEGTVDHEQLKKIYNQDESLS